MYEFVKKLASDILTNNDFKKQQNFLAESVYKALALNNQDELAMIKALVSQVHNKQIGNAKLYAKNIHGATSKKSGSGVVFYSPINKDYILKELGDTLIISIASKDNQVLFQKIAFVQNKKDKTNKWTIDQNQLYLLTNFPTFECKSGLFGNCERICKCGLNKPKDCYKRCTPDNIKYCHKCGITLANTFGSLGHYGLFKTSGDMFLANSRIIRATQTGKVAENRNIKYEDLIKLTAQRDQNGFGHLGCGHWRYHPECYEMFRYLYKDFGSLISMQELPFLTNRDISSNIYEFIKNWTQFNIGETVVANKKPLDNSLSWFATQIANEVAQKDLYINYENQNNETNFKKFKVQSDEFFKNGGSATVTIYEI